MQDAHVANQGDRVVVSAVERSVAPKLPLQHVTLQHKPEVLLNAGAEAVESFQHLDLESCGRPRVGPDEAPVRVRGRLRGATGQSQPAGRRTGAELDPVR